MPLSLRSDFNARGCRELASKSADGGQVRRLHALAALYDGASRAEAASIAGVSAQAVSAWVVRFNRAGPSALISRQSKRRLGPEHRAALAELLARKEASKRSGREEWRLADLSAWFRQKFGITVSQSTVGAELRAMGYRDVSRPSCSSPEFGDPDVKADTGHALPKAAITSRSPGRQHLLRPEHKKALVDLIAAQGGPKLFAKRGWRLADLCAWVRQEFGIKIAKSTMSGELRAMGYPDLFGRSRAK